MNSIEFSKPTRHCVVVLEGLPSDPDALPVEFARDLLLCGSQGGLASTGFNKVTSKWRADINDGFPGGTDRVKSKINAVLASYNLEATLKEVEEKWTVSVYVECISSRERRDQIERELKTLSGVKNVSWHPSFTIVQLTLDTQFTDGLKEEVTRIMTGQSPLF